MINTQIFEIDPLSFEDISLSVEDSNLITVQQQDEQFDTNNDQVELYVYLPPSDLIFANYNYSGWKSYQDPSLPSTGKLQDLYLNPEIDGQQASVTDGDVFVIYNFVRNQLLSSQFQTFYISTISSDRTEIALKSNAIPNQTLKQLVEEFIIKRNNTPYFDEFYLNFGDNKQLLGVNILLDESNVESYSVLIKLYEPLPSTFGLKNTCWVQTLVADPVGYRVNYQTVLEQSDTRIFLSPPNLNLSIYNQTANSNNYQTLSTLKSTSNTSSLNQLNSILTNKGVNLNIDYSDYSNFVHFSSAETRLSNFYYKAKLIETYQNDINNLSTTPATTARSQSIASKQGEISKIITQFDGYDYYLYYNSSSTAWPKLNSTPPYALASTGSAAVLNWIGLDSSGIQTGLGQLATASYYDSNNQNNLINTIPSYLLEDDNNLPYQVFVEMIGQHFDTLYSYTDNISEKYNTDNRLDYGVSKDLIAEVLKSFGLKIYENNFSTADLYSGLTGLTPSGSTLLLPDITTVFPVTGSGLEYIQTIISSSNDNTTLDDLNKAIYKRLYHNLPLLVKKKGTLAGLQLLRTIYGIPDTILRINEFGGKDKIASTWDQWQNTYNYALVAKTTASISSSWVLNFDWNAPSDNPQGVEFRFKTTGIPTTTGSYSQSLWFTDSGVTVRMRYTGSAYSSGSYTGQPINPYYQYGHLDFIPNISSPTISCSLYLPFFNGDWWSVLVNKDNLDYTLFAGNKIYDGPDGNTIGFLASSSLFAAQDAWNNSITSHFGSSSLGGRALDGYLQEIRYYTQDIKQETFTAYVMNPSSIEESDYLAFRAPLGGELYTGSFSVHPKAAGIHTTRSSFPGDSNSFYIYSTSSISDAFSFKNREAFFYDQVLGGIKNPVSNKIRVENTTQYGTVLSNQISIQQNYPISQSYTRDVNYLEVGFSPSNEINDDINSQFGYFNIGEYIGDPRFASESNYKYPDLESFSLEYFKKYNSSYNLQDYFRLIKFFDNSLFKLIKDFIPARTAAATGAIVKQHLLERNRQRPAQISYIEPYYTGSVTSLPRDYQTGSIEVFTGGAGGSVNVLTDISQSWTSSILTKAGLVTEIESSQYEFFNGEYSGSRIECQLSYSLNTDPLLNNVSSSRLSTIYEDVDYSSDGYRPVNLAFIQSGSAFLAPVQDSNYAITSSWSQLRYEGVKNTGRYNTFIKFASQSIAEGYPIDNITNYFARFTYDAGSNPEYPNGGYFKLIELINVDGTRIPLIGDNKHLSFVSQIFKAGKTVTAYGRGVSAIKTVRNIPVIEGGGYYQTVLAKSGSLPDGDFKVVYNNSGNYSTITYKDIFLDATVATSCLSDTGSGVITGSGWLSPLLNKFEPTYQTASGFFLGAGYTIGSPTLGYLGTNSGFISYDQTYFPLQKYDFIRIGWVSGSITSVDGSFNAGGLYRILNILSTGSYNTSSSLQVSPGLDSFSLVVNDPRDGGVSAGPNIFEQNLETFRIFRRISDETAVITAFNAEMNVDPQTGGLLVPDDFNPDYDPLEVARQANILI